MSDQALQVFRRTHFQLSPASHESEKLQALWDLRGEVVRLALKANFQVEREGMVYAIGLKNQGHEEFWVKLWVDGDQLFTTSGPVEGMTYDAGIKAWRGPVDATGELTDAVWFVACKLSDTLLSRL